jgi:hypothetical protein
MESFKQWIVEGQRRISDTDARERLKGCGKLLSDIDRADDRSRIRQRFLYSKLWQTVEDLMVNDLELKGKSERQSMMIAKVRPDDMSLTLGNRQQGIPCLESKAMDS